MAKSTPLNRREWLKATGATLAGVALATRLPASGAAPVRDRRQEENNDPAVNPATSERRYIHGFEPYPFP